MKNHIQHGHVITLVAGGAVTSGSPVFIGGLAAIPVTSGVSGDSISCSTCGVFELPKKAALAIVQGDDLYWDATPGEITKTAADGVPIGKAFKAAAGADTVVHVDINAMRSIAQAANVVAAAVANADATYGQPEADLINELKTQLNAALAALKAAGLMAADA